MTFIQLLSIFETIILNFILISLAEMYQSKLSKFKANPQNFVHHPPFLHFLSPGLVELLWTQGQFQSLLSAVLLCKCFRAKLWHDSKFVSKQLEGIGKCFTSV